MMSNSYGGGSSRSIGSGHSSRQPHYPAPLTSRRPRTSLSESLTSQRWDTIGLIGSDDDDEDEDGLGFDGDGHRDGFEPHDAALAESVASISATSDVDVMVEQLSSVLEYRLAEVVKGRKESGPDGTTQGGHHPHGGHGHGGQESRTVQRRSSLGSISSAASVASLGSVDSGGVPAQGAPHAKMRRRHSTASSVDVIYVSPMCRTELRDYVRAVADLYRDCRYHRFEHAVHVTLSANKLLDCLDEHDLFPEDDDCDGLDGTGHGSKRDVEQYFDSSSSIELDHRFQRELRRLSMVSRRSSIGSSVTGNGYNRRDSTGGMSRRDSALSGATGGTGDTGGASASVSTDGGVREDQNLMNESGVEGGVGVLIHEQDEEHEDEDDEEDTPPPQPRSSTFGIAKDPLTKFCLVYAALIHDVDHQGVPNRQLSREVDPLALLYNDKSIAEQNSLKVAFSTLMEPRFAELRHTLCPTSDDQFTFRRIVIDLVMCTDIASPERMQISKSKWAEAFGTKSSGVRYSRNSTGGAGGGEHGGEHGHGHGHGRHRGHHHGDNHHGSDAVATVTASRPRVVSMRRNSVGAVPTRHYAREGGRLGIKRALHLNGSTIEFYTTPKEDTVDAETQEVRLRASTVLETMMNAADVAHTLQSWENFLRWNRKLYEELYVAYVTGRCDSGGRDGDGEESNNSSNEDDPSVGWFGNQLGFYDIYILPLARKLRKCGVFGEEMGEMFVRNAKAIRSRWEYEGAAVTDDMVESVRAEYEEAANRGKRQQQKQQQQQQQQQQRGHDASGESSSLAAVGHHGDACTDEQSPRVSPVTTEATA